jgi:hypothetical protein
MRHFVAVWRRRGDVSADLANSLESALKHMEWVTLRFVGQSDDQSAGRGPEATNFVGGETIKGAEGKE